jgi:glycolate oxidase FAD binding subunit
VAVRCPALHDLLSGYGEIAELHTRNTIELWQEIRDVSFFDDTSQVWRLSVTPSEGVAVASRLGGLQYYLDWAGGLVWLAMTPEDDAGCQRIRGAINGGHATLMRASGDVRASVPVFQPQPDGLEALMKRVRAGFDPHGILNPGRV